MKICHTHVFGYTVVALVSSLAVTGTAAASGHLHVRSHDIVNGQVKTLDLGKDSVTSAKVGHNALTGSDINEPSLDNVGNSQALGGLPASAYGLAGRTVFNIGTAQSIQPNECLYIFAFGVGAASDAGKVVTGYITDSGGVNPPPSINNLTVFLPGAVFKTSQGGTIGYIQACNPTSSAKDLPDGWKLITSVKG
jgi:hypothetical protein